jgi:hypothetical protein
MVSHYEKFPVIKFKARKYKLPKLAPLKKPLSHQATKENQIRRLNFFTLIMGNVNFLKKKRDFLLVSLCLGGDPCFFHDSQGYVIKIRVYLRASAVKFSRIFVTRYRLPRPSPVGRLFWRRCLGRRGGW